MSKLTRILCVTLAIVVITAGQIRAQTTTGTTTGNPLANLTPAQLTQLMQLLQSSAGSSLLASLTGGTTGTSGTSGTSGTTGTGGTNGQAAATQPSTPKGFIAAGILRHEAFYKHESPSQASPSTQPFKLPITLVIPLLANWLGDRIPALAFLADLFGGLTPDDGGGTGPTPPPGKTGEGIVAFATADDTSLRVGQTTTARLWVQQSSPNATKTNGIFSVAVNVEASVIGVIDSTVPVTIVAPFGNPPVGGVHTGTVTQTGGIEEVTAGLPIASQNKSVGTNGPVEVFNWKIEAVGAGTVKLTPTNFEGGGFKGILDWSSTRGDQSKYVPVTITVQ